MQITFEQAVSAVGLLGTGGAIGTYLRILWERRNTSLLHQQEFKETRYKCIIMLMYAALDFEKRHAGLEKFGRSFPSFGHLLDELRAEWHNMILFGSDEALVTMHAFIESPSPDAFKTAALAMRKDLWGGKVSSALAELTFDTRGSAPKLLAANEGAKSVKPSFNS